jgi:hypothetical protein
MNFMINNGNGTFDAKVYDFKFMNNNTIFSTKGMINFDISTLKFNLISKYSLLKKSIPYEIITGDLSYDGNKLNVYTKFLNKYKLNFNGNYNFILQTITGNGELINSDYYSEFKINKEIFKTEISGNLFLTKYEYDNKIPHISYKINEKFEGIATLINLPKIKENIRGNIKLKNNLFHFSNNEINFEIGMNKKNQLLPEISGFGTLKLLSGKTDFNIKNNKKYTKIKGIYKDNDETKEVVNYDLNINKKDLGLTIKNLSINNIFSINGKYNKDNSNLKYRLDLQELIKNSEKIPFIKIPLFIANYGRKIFPKKYLINGNLLYINKKLSIETFINKKKVITYNNNDINFNNFTINNFIINGTVDLTNKIVKSKIKIKKKSKTSLFVKQLFGFDEFNIFCDFSDNKYKLKIDNKNNNIVNISLLSKNNKLYFKEIKVNLGNITFFGKGNIDSKGKYNGNFHSDRITENILKSFGFPKFFKGFDNIDINISGKNGKFIYKSTINNIGLNSKIFPKLQINLEPLKEKGYIVKINLLDNKNIVGKSRFFLKNFKNFDFDAMGFLELINFKPGETKMGENFINPGNINVRIDFEKNRENFNAKGKGHINNGYSKTKYGIFLKNISGAVKVKNEKIIFKNLFSNLKSDLVNITGWIQPFTKNKKANYSVNFESAKLSLKNIFSGLVNIDSASSCDVSLKLKMFPQNDLINLNGNIMLSNGIIVDSDLEKLKTINTKTKLFNDIHISLEEKIKLKTLLFESVATGDIYIFGTKKDHSISGDILVNSGKIHYLGKMFIIDNGKINFSTLTSPGFMCSAIKRKIESNNNSHMISGIIDYKYSGIRHNIYLEQENNNFENKIKTEISMRGKTRKNGNDIFINIDGDTKNINISFDAEPNIDEEEIEYMLFGIKLKGNNRKTETDDKDKFICFIENQLQSAIWNKIGESLEKKFNLDEFSIKTDRENESNPFIS